MHLIITAAFCLLFSSCLWEVETRKITSVLSVSNGGPWGDWGKMEFCPKGFIEGFSLKLPKRHGGIQDDTGIAGIRGLCSDGSVITSQVGKGGDWSKEIFCWFGYLTSFSLRVSEPQGKFHDDTAANNIKFKCSDGAEREGNGPAWGTYGKWSESCKNSEMCGLQTKVEKLSFLHLLDRTELNDIRFFCCL